MNKRTGKLIALLAVLAVAVAAYFVASAIAKREQNRNDTPDETKISIIDKETTDLVSVTVKAAGSDYTVAQSAGNIPSGTMRISRLIRTGQRISPRLSPRSAPTEGSPKPARIHRNTGLIPRSIPSPQSTPAEPK